MPVRLSLDASLPAPHVQMSNAAQRSELQAKPLKDFNMDTDSSLAHCGSLIFNAAQQQVLSVPLCLPLPASHARVLVAVPLALPLPLPLPRVLVT